MKKTILSLTLLAGTAVAAHAQQHATVGIAAAYGQTRLLNNNNYKSVGHSAYQAGLTADVPVTDALSFHPEVLYTLRYFDTSNDASLNRDVTSVDVPLLARYHNGGLFLEAGPELDVPVKAVNEDGNDIKGEVNSVALNYVAGLGYRLSNGLSLGLRYDGGASNLFKSNTATVLGSGKFKASTALVVLGYSFGGSSEGRPLRHR